MTTNTISSCEKGNRNLRQKIYSKDKYNIKSGQIQYSVKTKTIFRIDTYNIDTFPDLICTVHLDTKCQFVPSAFDKPFVVILHNSL